MGRWSPTERPEYYGGDAGSSLAQAFQNHVTQQRLSRQADDQHILSTVEAVRSGYQPPSATPPATSAVPMPAPAASSAAPGTELGREMTGGVDDPMAGDAGWGGKAHAPATLAGVMQSQPTQAAAPPAAAPPPNAPSSSRVAGAFDPSIGGFAPARINAVPAAASPAAPPSNVGAPPAGRELASAFGGGERVQLPDGGSIDPMAPERRQLGMYGAQQRIAGDERIRGERITREDEFQLAQRSIQARYSALEGVPGITPEQRRAAALDPKVYEELANPYNPNSPAMRAAALGDKATLARLQSGLDTGKELALEHAKSADEERLIPLRAQATVGAFAARQNAMPLNNDEAYASTHLPLIAQGLTEISKAAAPGAMQKLASRSLLGNYTLTPEGQKYNAAADRIALSGAVLLEGPRGATPQRQELFKHTYLPQPGDAEATVTDKLAQLRSVLQDGILKAGRGYQRMDPAARSAIEQFLNSPAAGAASHPAEQSIDEMIKAGKTDAEIKAALSGRP